MFIVIFVVSYNKKTSDNIYLLSALGDQTHNFCGLYISGRERHFRQPGKPQCLCVCVCVAASMPTDSIHKHALLVMKNRPQPRHCEIICDVHSFNSVLALDDFCQHLHFASVFFLRRQKGRESLQNCGGNKTRTHTNTVKSKIHLFTNRAGPLLQPAVALFFINTHTIRTQIDTIRRTSVESGHEI